MSQVYTNAGFKSDNPACAIVAPKTFSTAFNLSAETIGEFYPTDLSPLTSAQEGLTISTKGCNPMVIRVEFLDDSDETCGSCIGGDLTATTEDRFFYLNTLPSQEFATLSLPQGWWVDIGIMAISGITGDAAADFAGGVPFGGEGQAFEIQSLACNGCCNIAEVVNKRGVAVPAVVEETK